jgi:hypothetical protein
MAKLLVDYDPSLLPAGLEDRYHPTADQYLQSIRRIQTAIVQHSSKLKPTQVTIAKLHHKGKNNTQIAEEVGKNPTTVAKTLKLREVQVLVGLLQHYTLAVDGPKEAVRRAMLWRIATDNEQVAPKTAIAAIAEINKMEGVGLQNQAPAQTTIIINQETLPKTALDH